MATNEVLPTAILATGTEPAALPEGASRRVPGFDRFARRAGPDVAYKGPAGLTEIYAVFSVDPTSKQLRVAIVDADGRLVRMIPQGAVAEMLASMGRYRPG